MATGKILLKAFKEKVDTSNGEYHKSWSRKFGNKAQQAKAFFKRDKKIVGAQLATKAVKSAVGQIPVPGSNEGAALLEKIGGEVMKAAMDSVISEGESSVGGYFLKQKITSLKGALQSAKTGLSNIDLATEDALKRAKMEQFKREIAELERKKVKYEIEKISDHATKLKGRLFKLKESTRKSQQKLRAGYSVSSQDTEVDMMGRWSDYFIALRDVEHYQETCSQSINSLKVIIDEAEAYISASEATTIALRSKFEPELERAFNDVIRKYPQVTSLDKLEELVIQMSLESSGLA